MLTTSFKRPYVTLLLRKASMAVASVLSQRTVKYSIVMYSGQTIAALKGMQKVSLVLFFKLSGQIPFALLIHPCYMTHSNCIC